MPLWLDQLLPASFRNIPFQVDGITHQAGDNTVLREYPFQDLPTVFRMGEAAEEIKFSAYVIGDDYTLQRDRLREVLSGEGVLVHPTAGSMRVYVVGKYSIEEKPAEQGGMARFELTFVRAESRRYPVGLTNTPRQAIGAADQAQLATKDAFASAFDLTGKPGWAADRMVARITDSLGAVWLTMKDVTAGFGVYSNTVIGNYQALRDGLATLVRQPRLLADAMATLFQLPEDIESAAARDFAASFESLFDVSKRVTNRDFESSVVPPVGGGLVIYGNGNSTALGLATPARAQLVSLSVASDQLIESLAICGWVRAIASAELVSYADATALRATVNDQCTRLLLRASTQAASDNLPASAWHDGMLNLLGASLADIQDRSRDLARLTTFTPDGWMPVWVISYQLFGTADYADEILAMNPQITHPLLVPPGKPLRIMRRD